ncbi:MAG: helix-turn-helix domain-containing protein [Verrucomicrobiota bacterium]|nr:helix-turn-helix domain-containing protein [Verrucomicrobiota bacterium]
MDFFVMAQAQLLDWMMHEPVSVLYFAEHSLPAPVDTPPLVLVEFIFVQCGWMDIEVGSKTRRVETHQIACINAHHGNRAPRTSPDFRYACVSFTVATHPHHATWAAMHLLEVRDCPNPELLDTLYHDTAMALRAAGDARGRALLKASILRLLAHLPATLTTNGLPASPQLFRAQALLNARLADPSLSIFQIAHDCGCSLSTLNRLFRSACNQTPSQYLIAIRMARARTLLRQTRLSVKEIATLCGFSDPAYFSRAYTQNAGHPPSIERM